MYVDVGEGSSTDASLEALLTGTTTSRTWKIKVKSKIVNKLDNFSTSFYLQVAQILCDSIVKPPIGCMQYHTGLTGQVRSFNFQTSSGNYLHLALQYYKVQGTYKRNKNNQRSLGLYSKGERLLQDSMESE